MTPSTSKTDAKGGALWPVLANFQPRKSSISAMHVSAVEFAANPGLLFGFVGFDHGPGDFGCVRHVLGQVSPLLHACLGGLDFHFGAISEEDAGTIRFFLPVLNAIRQDLEEHVLLLEVDTCGVSRPCAASGASGFIAAGAAAFGAGASIANFTPALRARSESRDRIGFPLTPAPCARSAIPWSFETAAQQEIFDHSARLTHGFHGKRNYSAHVHTFGIGGDTELVNGLRSTPAPCARSVIKAQLCAARLEA